MGVCQTEGKWEEATKEEKIKSSHDWSLRYMWRVVVDEECKTQLDR